MNDAGAMWILTKQPYAPGRSLPASTDMRALHGRGTGCRRLKAPPVPNDAPGQLAAAAAVAARMEPGTLCDRAGLLARRAGFVRAGHRPTILGVDAVLDGRQVGRDATAVELEGVDARPAGANHPFQ